ncbi:hypothetical protein RND71_009331 [Anisodus tanguticus]|uniref:Knottins-like domain-containing protein n=1 Tax=Anisodus tanguticus TaxID=243964 RepID=A0AAE1SFL2_9SOLA|nr:hypothetical protein RND71_009328 [Anisodus tanguticus]KAK4369854.1 hypothetical protein RND71_009329 [Anisodus tanguticus]KAK4369855.1 hypothetical protein RND71_009330 [Anisodus tanguticus]KAK4369856.1 hypothetical protein RND71_009331 [Anisodus tanguticus]
MEYSSPLLKVVFFLVLFFMGNAEANICQAQSRTYKGPCVETPPAEKCTSSCKNEGYQYGVCDNSQCYCFKPCPPNYQLP